MMSTQAKHRKTVGAGSPGMDASSTVSGAVSTGS